MKTYLITEDELGAAELRAFTYDMALSTSGEYVLLPYLLRSAHHRKCFHFTQNPVVSVTNKHPETLERRDVTGQKPFVTEHVVWSTPPLLIHLVKTAGILTMIRLSLILKNQYFMVRLNNDQTIINPEQ